MGTPIRIDRLTWPEYQGLIAERPVVLPVGATEQHGVHLPLGTDALCATALAERVSAETGALVAPTVSYGYRSIPRSGGGEEFPGTTGLSLATMVATVRELLTQLVDDGARGVCVLSGHFENRVPVHEAAYEVSTGRSGVTILALMWADFLAEETLGEVFPDGMEYPGIELEHAAFLETSVMLHLYPELVREIRADDERIASFPAYDTYPTPEGLVPSSGSLAPTAGASAEVGKRVVDECVDGMVRAVGRELHPAARADG